LLFFLGAGGAGGLPPPQWFILRPLTAAAVILGLFLGQWYHQNVGRNRQTHIARKIMWLAAFQD